MARKRRARNSGNGSQVLIVIGLVLAIAAFAAGVSYLYMNRSPAPDKLTLCPASGPVGQVVVLVDTTDPYKFIQREAFNQALEDIVGQQVREGELLTVYALGEDFTKTAAPLFEKCNPGTDAGKSEMTANLKRIRDRYNSEFQDPLLALEDVLLVEEPAKYSPVFEMLQLVSINGFRGTQVEGPKTLIVFSDMLPNTADFSMFKGIPEYEQFDKTTYGQRSKTDFKGVRVELNYLMNYPQLQTRKQLGFWEQYFEKAGGRIVKVRTMEG